MHRPMRKGGREVVDVARAATPTHAHLRGRILFAFGATLVLDAIASVLILGFERNEPGPRSATSVTRSSGRARSCSPSHRSSPIQSLPPHGCSMYSCRRGRSRWWRFWRAPSAPSFIGAVSSSVRSGRRIPAGSTEQQ